MKIRKIQDARGIPFLVEIEDNNNVITQNGVYHILDAKKINFKNARLVDVLYRFFAERELSYDDAWQILTGASKLKVLAKQNSDIAKVELEEFLEKVKDRYNLGLYEAMGAVDKKFKKYIRDEFEELVGEGVLSVDEAKIERRTALSSIDSLIKSAWKKIKGVTEEFDERLGNFSIEALEDLYAYACIYDAIVKHTPTRKWTDAEGKEYLRVADDIFMNGYLNLQKPEDLKSVAGTIHDLLEAMTALDDRYGKGERFTSSEIANILVKTPSLMHLANAEKFRSIQECLVGYVNELTELAKGGEFESALKTLTAKDIIKRSASILSNSENSIVQATNFLLGKTVKDIYELQPSDRKSTSSEKLLKDFPNMQITDMSLEDNLRVATKQASIITSLNFSSLYTVVENLLDIIIASQYPNADVKKLDIGKKKELVEKLGVDYNRLITGKNVSTLFRVDVKKHLGGEKAEDMKNNIRLLTNYVDFKTIVNAMKNNFNVLLQQDGVLKTKIDEILSEFPDTNSDEFKRAFIELLNDEYYAGLTNEGGQGHSRKVKKDSEDSVGIIKGTVDVGFIGDKVRKKIFTDEEKYKLVNEELNMLGNLCDAVDGDGLSFDGLDDIAISWGILKEEVPALKAGVLSGQLRRPILADKTNLTPQVSIETALRKIIYIINSIERDDIRTCLAPELKAVAKKIEKLVDKKLLPAIKDVENSTGEFYKSDKKHTKTPSAKKYKNAKDVLTSQLDELSRMDKSLISMMSGIDALREDQKKFDSMEKNLIKLYKAYAQKRASNNDLEIICGELKEFVAMLNITKNSLLDTSKSVSKTVPSAPKKPVDFADKKQEESKKDKLEKRLNALRVKVGEKIYGRIKTNYKGKDFIRLCHSLRLEYGDDLHTDLLEIADILKELDKINKAENNTVISIQ